MKCADCGLEITEDEAGAGTLHYDYESIRVTGRCFGCEFKRLLNQRIDKIHERIEDNE
jgi:DNA-directed RNA polymerase subunit RPC12/RpoP